MKVCGHGQSKVLNSLELRQLFTRGFTSPRDKALFAICLFTGCRISEALALQVSDFKGETLTFRKSNTKGRLKTRQVNVDPGLFEFLCDYQGGKWGWLFPGQTPVNTSPVKPQI